MDLRRLRRLAEEIAARPVHTSADELRSLAVHVSTDRTTLTITRRGREEGALAVGAAIAAAMRAPEVVLAPGLYPSIGGSEARVALLELARALTDGAVIVHARVDEATSRSARASRVLLDGPRGLAGEIARRLGRPSPLPAAGDRLAEGRFVHVFADEVPLLLEIAAAGLAVAARDGSRWELVPTEDGSAGPERRAAVLPEIARALRLLARVERARAADSPARAVEQMRALGRGALARSPLARARLRRAIGWVDALPPSGPNCYRRTLLELALDAGAAREPLVFGLDVGRTGHVAFKGREELGFDVLFEIPPGP